MLSRVRMRCHGVWWFSVGILVILSLRRACATPVAPDCPSISDNVLISDGAMTSIITTSVTVDLTLRPGLYDELWVVVYRVTGSSLASSGSRSVTPPGSNPMRQSFTIDLHPELSIGEEYSVSLVIRSGNVCSYPFVPERIVIEAVPSAPTLDNVAEASGGGIQVTWVTVSSQVNQIVVYYQAAGGTERTYTELVSDNTSQQQTVTISDGLVKGQTYNVSAATVSGGVLSQRSNKWTITLAPPSPTLVNARDSYGAIVVTWTIGTAPPSPTSVQARESSGTIVVTWMAGTGQVDQYDVSARTAQGAVITKTVDSQAQTTTVSQDRITPGQTYTIRVTAVSNSVQSTGSPQTHVTIPPSSPSLTSVTEQNAGIMVCWTPGLGVADRFVMYYQVLGALPLNQSILVAGNPPWPQTATIPAGILVRGQTYNVSVRAASRTLQSPPSAEISITLSPFPPVSVSVIPNSGDQTITVTWEKGVGIVSKFFVRAEGPGAYREEDEIPYDDRKTQYRHTLKPSQSGGYNIWIKSQSETVNSSDSAAYNVQLSSPASPASPDSPQPVDYTWVIVGCVVGVLVVAALITTVILFRRRRPEQPPGSSPNVTTTAKPSVTNTAKPSVTNTAPPGVYPIPTSNALHGAYSNGDGVTAPSAPPLAPNGSPPPLTASYLTPVTTQQRGVNTNVSPEGTTPYLTPVTTQQGGAYMYISSSGTSSGHGHHNNDVNPSVYDDIPADRDDGYIEVQ